MSELFKGLCINKLICFINVVDEKEVEIREFFFSDYSKLFFKVVFVCNC